MVLFTTVMSGICLLFCLVFVMFLLILFNKLFIKFSLLILKLISLIVRIGPIMGNSRVVLSILN